MTSAAASPVASALDTLWAKLSEKGDLPALGRSVQLVAQLAESDQAKVDALAAVVLRDVALASRVLRLANSAAYRRSNAGEVTTIARALVVLGFETVRNLALTTAVFDRLGEQNPAMQQLLARALFSALFAEALAPRWQLPREGAFLAALFRHLGLLLVQHHLPEEAEQIALLVSSGMPQSKAEQQVLGVSCAALGLFVAKAWGLPTAVVNALEPVAGGVPQELAPKSPQALVWLASAAEAVGERLAETGAPLTALLPEEQVRYPFLRTLTPAQWQTVAEESSRALRHWWQALVADPLPARLAAATGGSDTKTTEGAAEMAGSGSSPSEARVLGASASSAFAVPAHGRAATPDPAAPFDPTEALTVLAAGLEELTQTLLERQPWSVIGYLACEVAWRALKCERVLLFLRKGQALVPVAGIAPEWRALKAAGWVIPLGGAADVFQLALQRGVDIEIDDRNAPSLASKIPDVVRRLPRGASVLLLPLKGGEAGGVQGLLYCDKPLPQQLRLPAALKALLRQWRNLAALACRERAALRSEVKAQE